MINKTLRKATAERHGPVVVVRYTGNLDEIPCFYGDECHLEKVEEWLDEQPTIDAEPVRHAVWDNSGRYRFKNGRIATRCTSCGCALSESSTSSISVY